MNLSPVRTALRHKSDYVCLPCSLRISCTARWQQPVRNRTARIIIPNLSSSVAASLHDTIDRADRAERSRAELKRKPPNAKVDGSRPKNPSPQLPSPAASKKSPVLQKTPSHPATAPSKATAARHSRRADKPHEDLPEAQEAVSQTKSPKRQDASSKGKVSRKKSSSSELPGKPRNALDISVIIATARTRLLKSLSDSSPEPQLKKTADAEVGEQHRDQAKDGGVGASSTGIGEKDLASSESHGSAKPQSDSIPPKQNSTDTETRLNRRQRRRSASKSLATKKLRSDSPPGTPTGSVVVKKVKTDKRLWPIREGSPISRQQPLVEGIPRMEVTSDSLLKPPSISWSKNPASGTGVVRRVHPKKNVPELVRRSDHGESRRQMILEERLKEHTKSVQAATGTEAVRRSKPRAVSRAVSKRKTEKEPIEPKAKATVQHINAVDLDITAVKVDQPPVPTLAYGLERVLFNPGVYHLQDPRSQVYNFDPYLQTIMPPSEFDFSALKEYITSSRDEALISIAEEHGKRYVGSSSSMTGVLAQFHFLLSQWRKINTSMVSRGFPDKLDSFTLIQRCPTAIFLRWKDGTYAIDADKEFATSNVLSMLGKSMEKLLTLKTEDFERYRKSNPEEVPEEARNTRDSFHYSTMGDFLMRSQLDAHDPRLPGTGMFDLKTRAVVTVRMNIADPVQGSGYEIQGRLGEWESYEREYFDMIRSAFLKYSLQVRMGRMDGIFVAFHNTERIFGFQYVSLEEMDLALHGQSDTTLGNQEFKLSIDLLNTVLNKATERFPAQSIRLHFETRDTSTNFMYIFAEPVTEEQVEELQSKNAAAIDEFERELLGLSKDAEKDHPDEWDDIQAKVEEAMDKDERGIGEAGKGEDIVPEVVEFDDRQQVNGEVAAYEEGEDASDGAIIDGLANGAAIDDAQISDEDSVEGGEELEESGESESEELEEHECPLDEAGEIENIVQDEGAGEDHETEEAQDEEEDARNGDIIDGLANGAAIDDAQISDEDSAEEGEELEESEESESEELEEHECPLDEAGEIENKVEDEGVGEDHETEKAQDEEDGEEYEIEEDEADADELPEEDPHPDESAIEPPIADVDTIEPSFDTHEPSDLSTNSEAHSDSAPTSADEATTEPPDFDSTADPTFLNDLATESMTPESSNPILAMTLTIRNKVDGAYVLRPQELTTFSGSHKLLTSEWSVEYTLREVEDRKRAWTLYQACQERRRNQLDKSKEEENGRRDNAGFMELMKRLTARGRTYREGVEKRDAGREKVVFSWVGEGAGKGEGGVE